MDYFIALQNLLKIERETDLQQYRKQTEQSSVTERRANGLTWYPIAIRGNEMTAGDYIQIEVERTTNTDLPHQLRFGMSAALFSNHDAKNNRIEGVIAFQGGNRLKLTLRTEELPEWASDGKLGIDVLFDDNSYDEMQAALKLAIKKQDDPEEKLLPVLIGEKDAAFQEEFSVSINSTLNSSQQEAVRKIVQANELAIVHGPPGTGKTTTLIHAIQALIKQGNQKILVVAPSNTAVDLLTEKLAEQKINVLRIGNPARVSEQMMSHTLDFKMSAHAAVKEIKRLKKQASEFKNMAHKYKRSFGKSERDQRKLLFDEAHKIMKEVGKTEQYIVDDLIAKAQVITATLVGANHYTIRHLHFDVAVIDEAGQALEPACWIPILKTKKVVLAGDHCQLSPTIKSYEAAKQGLSKTLFEKCIERHPNAVALLEVQYRMHTSIMGYSSKVFYGNKLQAHTSVASHLLFAEDSPLLFLDTAGCGFDEKQDGTSTFNPEEASLLFKHVVQLTRQLSVHISEKNYPSIAIISPYKEQINVLKEYLQQTSELTLWHKQITVNTIDSFQGQERDIVYISMTRSNSKGEIGFLSDIRRMNVAMTRARKKLVIVGDSATLAKSPFYKNFIDYAEKMDGYESAWAIMNVD
jgi:superfamily I DNA and/or RNA helicase